MEIKTYRARSMQEALALVRHDLGPDAAVLHTREVRADRWFGLIQGKREIEVTASAEVNVPSRLPRRARKEPAPSVPAASAAPAAGHASWRPAEAPEVSALGSSPPAADEAMKNELSHLKLMLNDLCRRSRPHAAWDMPEGLFRLFTELIEADLSEEVAREFVGKLRAEAAGTDDADPQALKARVARHLESEIRTSGPIATTPGRRRLVALVGPTGVGKTTTIAKLAANYRLKQRKNVGLITVDTYRIAAVEQLRTYAEIIDLPMQVVSTPREMRDAARRMEGLDLILLDTAGRSPRDDIKIQELKAFLTEAGADEVHLVLSSVAGPRTLAMTTERFAAAGTTHLIFTKLDEATGLGGLLPVVRSSGLPLSYLTAGQNVPDDIDVADSARLARLMLGMNS